MSSKRPCGKDVAVSSKKAKFACDPCDYASDKMAKLKRHHDGIHAEKKHACEQCDKRFGSEQLLGAHLKKTHAAERKYACDLCDYASDKMSKLKRHHDGIHAEKNYACVQCDKRFGSEQLLGDHLKKTHAVERKYACEHCDYLTLYASNLRKHHEQVHAAKTFSCGTCDAKFGGQKALEVHVKIHVAKPLKCDKCERTFTRQHNLKVHANIHEGIYKCDKCNQAFRNAAHLQRHVSAVHKKKKFHCNQCGKAFAEPSTLKEHCQVNHSKDLACTSDGCDFVGVDYKAIEDHLVAVHSDHRARKCSICDTWFARKAGLKTHLSSVHNGERHYDCWCGYATNRKSHFEAHEAKDDCTPQQLNFGELGKVAKSGALTADYVLDGKVLGSGFTGVGTRMFAAPELNKGAGSATPQTDAIDVWPLPLIAMECLTQSEIPEFDFIDDNFRAEVHAWCERKLIANDLPQPTQVFKDFVNACLVKKPADRFTARALLALPFLENADDLALQSLVQQILS